jgi:hypothetical protein
VLLNRYKVIVSCIFIVFVVENKKTALVCFLSGNITLVVFLTGKPTVATIAVLFYHMTLNESIFSSNRRKFKKFKTQSSAVMSQMTMSLGPSLGARQYA